MTLAGILTTTSIVFGFISAGAWLRASVVRVTAERASSIRKKRAKRTGKLQGTAVVLSGVDVKETQAAQSLWNAAGALSAATAMLCQALAQLLA